MALSRDDILKQEGPGTEEVDVPEWGGTVLVRGMTGTERDEWEMGNFQQKGKRMVSNTRNARARLLVSCIVDEDGVRVFQYGDIEALGAKSGKALDRIFEVAARLSGIGPDDEDSDEPAGTRDFPPTTGHGSSTDSPKTSAARSHGSSQKQTAGN